MGRLDIERAATELANNEVLFLTGVLVQEFGPKQNWPTRQVGLELPPYLELLTNIKILNRINAQQSEGPNEPEDEFARKLQPKTSGSDKFKNLPETEVSRKVKAKRAQRYANRKKMLNERAG